MIRFDIFGRRFVVYFRKVQEIKGLNSECKDGSHIVMVDIDDEPLQGVQVDCYKVMAEHMIQHAEIMSTGKPNGWHVYLWKGFTFRESLQIMLEFEHCDLNHVRWTIKRGHATLRLTDKQGRKIRKVKTLHSPGTRDMTLKDLKSWVKYQTGVWEDGD